jgi:hypothetical protein
MERRDNSGKVNYRHYILLSDYSGKCFPWINFSQLAKHYIDTCSVDTPIGAVTFIKSAEGAGFDSGELNAPNIQKNEIIGFGVRSKSIVSVFISHDGVKKMIRIEDCDWSEN